MAVQDEREIEKVLELFERQTAARLRPILYANLVGGRIATYLMNDDHTLEQYVQTVAGNYQASSGYLYQLQVLRDGTCWRPFLEQIQRWVFALFLKKGLSRTEAEALVEKTTENSALKIIITLFPYDVPFNIWAIRLTQIQCCQTLAKMRGIETGS